MNTKQMNPKVLAVALLSMVTLAGRAQPVYLFARTPEFVTNRISFSDRWGVGISARFKSIKTPILQSQRTTPDGAKYNYDDGYVLTDVSKGAGGKTWNWGYDDSSAQVSGNNVLLSRDTARVPGSDIDENPNYGGEIVFTRMIERIGHFNLGFEFAANYTSLSFNDSSPHDASLAHTTDAYPFTPGTTPPTATPGSPYQGTFQGPGFVVGDTPVSSTSTPIPGGATTTGQRQFDANVWGFRIGPCVELPVNEKLTVSLSGGVAGGIIDAKVSWNEHVASGTSFANLRGSGQDLDMLWGYYIAANVALELDERWSIVGSAQYQSLNNYSHSFGGRRVEGDFNSAWFFTLGVGLKF